MNADGTGQRRLTGDLGLGGYGGRPAWSPDGQRITFQADGKSEGNDGGIYVINADGSEQHRLTEIPHVWHCGPSSCRRMGERIAFGGVVGGTLRIPLRREPRRQQAEAARAVHELPRRLHGRLLVAGRTRDRLLERARRDFADIQVIGIDGTGLRRLTRDPASDVDAAWQPAPSRG